MKWHRTEDWWNRRRYSLKTSNSTSKDNNLEVEIINRDTGELLFCFEEQKIHHPILHQMEQKNNNGHKNGIALSDKNMFFYCGFVLVQHQHSKLIIFFFFLLLSHLQMENREYVSVILLQHFFVVIFISSWLHFSLSNRMLFIENIKCTTYRL